MVDVLGEAVTVSVPAQFGISIVGGVSAVVCYLAGQAYLPRLKNGRQMAPKEEPESSQTVASQTVVGPGHGVTCIKHGERLARCEEGIIGLGKGIERIEADVKGVDDKLTRLLERQK